MKLGEQSLDVGMLSGEIGFSTKTLADISEICIYGDRLVTIENLTTFHRFSPQKKAAVLYLGGYHNRTKRAFLKKLYEQNPDILYFHFGDIDAGGFYIYEHLKKKTGIPFRTWKMDTKTITDNIAYAKPLTANDRKRLEMLKEKYREKENLDTINTMLERNLKLEQEAIRDLSL